MTREKDIYKVTLVGSVGNLALLAFKFVAGIVGHSAAMIADAVHSLSDFVTDLVVLAFVRVSAQPQDRNHKYGHGKYETLATFFVGLALVAAALGIMVPGAIKFVNWLGGEKLAAPGKLALWAALVSIAVKELLYRYTAARGRALNSQAVVANAWHHRSDALSSVAAAIGIGGAIALGERWTVLDPLASVIVGLLLLKVAWALVRQSMGELTERALPKDEEDEILQIITSCPAVTEPHNLRTRRIGNRVAIDAHFRMDASMTLKEAHDHATAIEQRLKTRFGPDTLVTLHMEPTKPA